MSWLMDQVHIHIYQEYHIVIVAFAHNIASVKSRSTMKKLYMVQNYNNDILEGLVIADPLGS
jgi:hypothetical protein